MTDTKELSSEAGFGLIEILVAMVFVGIVSLAVTTSLTTAMRTEKLAGQRGWGISIVLPSRCQGLSPGCLELFSLKNCAYALTSSNIYRAQIKMPTF